MTEGLHACCIRAPKRIGTNCDTRSFSNFDTLQHTNRAFPDRGSSLNNDQFAVLHNILSVVGVFGTPNLFKVIRELVIFGYSRQLISLLECLDSNCSPQVDNFALS